MEMQELLKSDKKSGWLKSAKRRNKWRLIRKLIFKFKVKYYRLKRIFYCFYNG